MPRLSSEMDRHRQWESLFLPHSFSLVAMFPRHSGFRGRTRSSLLWLIVDWRPGYKHNNNWLFLWSFSIWLFTAFMEPAYSRSLLFIAVLSLNEGKDVETLPSVYKPLITLSLSQNVPGLQVRSTGEPEDRYAHYEEIILWGFLSCWTSLTDNLKLTSSWRLDQNHIPRSGPLLLIMTIMRLIIQLKWS